MLFRRRRSTSFCSHVTIKGWAARKCDSQSLDNSQCGFLVVKKSGADVRYHESEPFKSANLIIHQGIADIFYQIIKLPCILRAVEEICGVPSGHHWGHGLADISQFPDNPPSVRLSIQSWGMRAHNFNAFVLFSSLESPRRMDGRSNSETLLTRDVNNFMAC